jgi:nucleotidyltransferase/DNA polymerase involved in DNA repair
MAISAAMRRVIFHLDMDAPYASIERVSIDEAYLDLTGLSQSEDADDRILQSAWLKHRDNLNLPARFNDHIFPLCPHLIVQQQLEHHFAFGLLR